MSGIADGRRAAFAPAKINLYLHVGALRADGYHPISSLMVFADVGDQLEILDESGEGLEVTGPFAGGAPATGNNLVLRASRAIDPAGARRFRLEKAVPVGAGLGGGSADAAAVLRLLAGDRPQSDVLEVASRLGSDVPACVLSEPVTAQGRGEQLSAGPAIASTPAVLVYPDAPVSTAAVYHAFDVAGAGTTADGLGDRAPCRSPYDVAALVTASRNDLEPAALALQPRIGEALALLRDGGEALVARMSGSGSACFAICPTGDAAQVLARRIAAARTDWWVRACHIGGRPL